MLTHQIFLFYELLHKNPTSIDSNFSLHILSCFSSIRSFSIDHFVTKHKPVYIIRMRFKARYHTVCITFIVVLQLCQGGDPEEEHPQDLLSHDNPQNVIADENLPPEFATLPSSDNPDELNKANKPKKTTTCATDDSGPSDSVVTLSDSGDVPPLKKKTKTTSPDPYGLDNFGDPPLDIPAKKKNVTTTESDGSSAESFLTPTDTEDAPLPKKGGEKKNWGVFILFLIFLFKHPVCCI
uniref:Uncharacterized protein n=1 Tax=Cacopsylla melanoneura TaxID=428564 RepID=A0A8D8W834_9HEMI